MPWLTQPFPFRHSIVNHPRKKPDPTVRVAVLIVVAVSIVIGTLLFNAIRGKLEYERAQRAAQDASAPAAASAAPAAVPASQ